MASIRQPLIHQNNHQKQPQPQKYRPHQKSPHLPASGNNCERIVQGVAKLSAFRIPPNHLKRCSEGMLPFSEHLICPQPKILINGINARHLEKKSHRPPQLISSSSSNYLLRVNQNGVPAMSGKRMLSLDSCAPLAVGKRLEWLRTQQILVAEAEELARRRKKSCWNGVGASYAFLALSVLLSLSVVIGVCLFLHSFVPKEYYYNATTHNGSSSHVNANGQRMGKAVRMDAAGGIGHAEQKAELGTGNAMEYRTFADPIKPAEFLMFYKRRRR